MATPTPPRLDAQHVELIGRNLLTAQLLADGVEVADLDLDEALGFAARPIQLKAASGASFSVDRKYDRFPHLLHAYVSGVARPLESRIYYLTQHETIGVAQDMGWTASGSWRRGRYSTSRPSARLVELLEPFLVAPGGWPARLLPAAG
ncbi:MAG: hypothetical protein ACKVWR_07685 [Acidimicrobiales bacterium]